MYEVLRDRRAIAMLLFSTLKEKHFHIICTERHIANKECSRENSKLTGLYHF
jgi:hypothetical protein